MSVYSPGARVGAEQVAALLSAADQIVELNLQDAGLDDAALAESSASSRRSRGCG